MKNNPKEAGWVTLILVYATGIYFLKSDITPSELIKFVGYFIVFTCSIILIGLSVYNITKDDE